MVFILQVIAYLCALYLTLIASLAGFRFVRRMQDREALGVENRA